jgi:IMP cyclohydrolase
MSARSIARETFDRYIARNPYPGRGLVIGRSTENEWLLLYWIMGRSAQSRNRRFAAEGGVLRTEPVDASLVKDPSLIIYEAMLELPGLHLVSNGDQTRTAYQAMKAGGTFEGALATREREPDAPNFTPRISGLLDLTREPGGVALSILRAGRIDPQETDRHVYRPAPPAPGFGFGLTTYSGDGDPLPSFSGDPLLLPLDGAAEAVLETYWSALHAENRISLAVKAVTPGAGSRLIIRNRF